jgi:hypothetical protein
MIRAVRRCILPAAALAAACFAHPLTASAGTGDALHELASRYAPVVRLSEQQAPCARGESFEPIDVNAIFGNDDVTLRGPSGFAKVAPSTADIASDHEGYALDFPGNALSSSACSYETWQRKITAGRAATVYAHVATESGELALQYWLFYVYNDFNNLHEGDWELIQLDFDAATPAAALATHPFEVGYSQHAGAERAEWDARSSSSSAGRTRSSIRPRGRTPTTSPARSSSDAAQRRVSAATTRTSRGGSSGRASTSSRRAGGLRSPRFRGSATRDAGANGGAGSTTRRRGRTRRTSGRRR